MLWGALFLLVLCGICFFVALGGLPLSGPDEPRYAEVGREMWASGDWITPRLDGYLWLEKPALLYWGQAASYHLFGVNEFAARFSSALMAALMVMFIAYALAKLGHARWGFWSGAALATSTIWFALARAASTDMVLAGTMSLSLLSGFLALRSTKNARAGFWMLFAFWLGASMLAKGLISILLVCGILFIYRLLMRQSILSALRNNALTVGVGALVFLATIATWYVPVYQANGMVFINEFFVNHHFKRFFTSKYHHPQSPLFYLFIALVGTLPWTFWLVPGLARLRRLRARDDGRGALLLFAWIWAALPIAFFSVSESKLPAYILPSFPAFAIIIGAEIERVWRGKLDIWSQIGLALTAVVAAGVGIGFVVFARKEGVILAGFGFLGMAVPLLLGIFTLVAWILKRRQFVIGGTVALTVGLIFSAIALLFPVVGPQQSKKEISVAAAKALKPGENIVFYRKQKEYAPVFYAQGRVLFFKQVMNAKGDPIPGKSTLLPRNTLSTGDEIDALTPDELLLALDASPTGEVVALTQMSGATELAADARLDTELIAQQGKVMALRVRRVGNR